MLAAQRHELILDRVRALGAVRVADLVRELHVSDMTVRRDLDVLARDELLEKVHGGATALRVSSTEEPAFATKRQLERLEKEAIARVAVAHVRPGSAIGLSAGTTTWTLAQLLLDVPGITVVTNSIQVADLLYTGGRPDQTVVLTGGVRTPSDALVGPVAVAALASLNLDLVFMGVHGFDSRAGFTTPNLMEADTDRALIGAGRRLVVVADHTKWGVVGISTIAQLSEADVLIVDDGLDRRARAEIGELVGEVQLAPCRTSRRRRPAGSVPRIEATR